MRKWLALQMAAPVGQQQHLRGFVADRRSRGHGLRQAALGDDVDPPALEHRVCTEVGLDLVVGPGTRRAERAVLEEQEAWGEERRLQLSGVPDAAFFHGSFRSG